MYDGADSVLMDDERQNSLLLGIVAPKIHDSKNEAFEVPFLRLFDIRHLLHQCENASTIGSRSLSEISQ